MNLKFFRGFYSHRTSAIKSRAALRSHSFYHRFGRWGPLQCTGLDIGTRWWKEALSLLDSCFLAHLTLTPLTSQMTSMNVLYVGDTVKLKPWPDVQLGPRLLFIDNRVAVKNVLWTISSWTSNCSTHHFLKSHSKLLPSNHPLRWVPICANQLLSCVTACELF